MVLGSLFGKKTKTSYNSATTSRPSEGAQRLFDQSLPTLEQFGSAPPVIQFADFAPRNQYELGARNQLQHAAHILPHVYRKYQKQLGSGQELARAFLPGESNIRRLGGGRSALHNLAFSNLGDRTLDTDSAVQRMDAGALTAADLAQALGFANQSVTSPFVQQSLQTMLNPLRDQFNAELSSNVMNAAAAGQLGSSRTDLAGSQAIDRFADRAGSQFSAGLTPIFSQAMQGALGQALGRGQQALAQEGMIDQYNLNRFDMEGRGRQEADRLSLQAALGLDAFANEQNRLALAQDQALDAFALGRGQQGLQYGQLARDIAPIMADMGVRGYMVPAQIQAQLGAEQRAWEQQLMDRANQERMTNEWLPYMLAMNNIGIGAGLPGGTTTSTGSGTSKTSQGLGSTLLGLGSAALGLGGGSGLGGLGSFLGGMFGGGGGSGAGFIPPVAPVYGGGYQPAPGGYMSGVPQFNPYGGAYAPSYGIGNILGSAVMGPLAQPVRFR